MTSHRQQNEERFITILVMKDAISEPFQLRLNVRRLKLAAYLIVIIPAVLFLSLLITGKLYTSTARENKKLYTITKSYRVSEEQLSALSSQLNTLETRTATNTRATQALIAGMSKDIKRWLPKSTSGGSLVGGVGGGAGSLSENEALPASGPSRPLSSSQLERLGDLQARLAQLDARLKSSDLTAKELERSWNERNSLFSSMPSFWPLAHGRITSTFGMRIHPIMRRLQMHEGLDISAPFDTLIYSAGQGIVTFAGYRSGYGNFVTIDHGFGFTTNYGHCSQLLVSAGAAVQKGQPIAKVGSTGLSTGPHLHFEVRIKGVPVDPLDYVSIFSQGPMQ